jgi:hypothetical protein
LESRGSEQIQKSWLTAFPAAHRHIARNFNAIVEELKKIAEWMTRGITYLLPKLGDSKEVRNYRPITCLTTTFKTLTVMTARRISTYLDEQYLLPAEQKEFILAIRCARIN